MPQNAPPQQAPAAPPDQARLIPLRLRDVDAAALAATAIYLRNVRHDGTEEFHLYRSPDVAFTAVHYARLLELGTETVYIAAPKGEYAAEKDAAAIVDKRSQPRSRLWCAASLIPRSEPGEPRARANRLKVQVFDISRGGLGVLSRTELEVGTLATVYLDVPGWARRPLRTVVRRCTQRSAWCEVGLELF